MPKKSPPTKTSRRSPVVTIMGHIDHGKSTLLDYIRSANVVDGEAGGITQHVSAYEVESETGGRITFIDTPGHAAFSSVRDRSASVADIAILIVSAEDGAKPQTVEAYKSIEDSKTPVIVAINKVDSPKANVQNTKSSLVETGIYVEGFGGKIPAIEVSAKTGEGIPELLEMILLVAELEDLDHEASAPASGIVIEANVDKQKGISATMIIKSGTLTSGSFIVCGDAIAPLRIIEDFKGKAQKTFVASAPVRVFGWNKIPSVGEDFIMVKNKKEAEKLASELAEIVENDSTTPLKPADKMTYIFPIIIKGDTMGTVEAIQQELADLNSTKVFVKVLYSGTGNVTEADANHAFASGATIVAFNVKVESQAKAVADRESFKIPTFSIIYELLDWITEKVAAETPKSFTRVVSGRLKILRVFSAAKQTQIVGGVVKEGNLTTGSKFDIERRGEKIGTGTIKKLQKQKLDVETVNEEDECGLAIERSIDISQGDMIVSYTTVEDK